MLNLLKRFFVRCSQIVLAFIVLTALAVLWHRWVNPDISAMMASQKLELQREGASTVLQQQWVDYTAIASPIKLAVIASEDQEFPSHYGFDMEAIRKAWQANQQGDDLRGASTITMQVAKNLYLWTDRTWLRKGLEAWFTLLIETLWSKQRILEIYLNIAQFDDRVFGVEAAANKFFNKPAAQLNRYEAALLAVVLPAPEVYRVEAPSGYIRERQLWTLHQMRRLGREHLVPVNAE
ncbi:MAG TPA: monofunctional biosynthetic peptidoglycan transglycosylase [Gammaproteobacteria bacterium]|nr:monofunctional biosynthetic peptidoglycan transglycosylase [Gammaproteobacteria bacterium]